MRLLWAHISGVETCNRHAYAHGCSGRRTVAGWPQWGSGGMKKGEKEGARRESTAGEKSVALLITCLALRYFLGAWARAPHHASHANAFDFNLRTL
jgi:hypothetical protein